MSAPADSSTRVSVGLETLLQLVQFGRKPGTWAAEGHAVTALEVLESGAAMTKEDQKVVAQLRSSVAALDDASLQALMASLADSTLWGFLPKAFRRSAPDRLRFLLVIALQIVATTSRYNVLNALHNQGALPEEATYDEHLRWIGRLNLGSRRVLLYRRYLELAARVWYGNHDRPSAAAADDYLASHFVGYGWRHQLVVLLALRHAWTFGAPDRTLIAESPAICADTPEFRLALHHNFSSLRTRGGRLAGLVLEKLQYADVRRSTFRRNMWSLAIIGCACVVLTISLMRVSQMMKQWHLETERHATAAKSQAVDAVKKLVPLSLGEKTEGHQKK